MSESRFVYVTYIRTTAERLWQALIDPEFTRRYLMETSLECTWEPGASWRRTIPDGRVVNSGQVVEIEPPCRLVLSWRHDLHPDVQQEGYSRCTFELQPQGDSVKLTVIHEIDMTGSKLIQGVSNGWPLILSSLKSLLETGQPLAATRRWPHDL